MDLVSGRDSRQVTVRHFRSLGSLLAIAALVSWLLPGSPAMGSYVETPESADGDGVVVQVDSGEPDAPWSPYVDDLGAATDEALALTTASAPIVDSGFWDTTQEPLILEWESGS